MTTPGHDAPLEYHRRLLDDPLRMDAYERALRRLVRPGDVVLDAGAGSGILAMLAARLGAARVHAVESMPIARLARQLVLANGLEDRVTVHEADLETMAPVEPVDLVISDYLGVFLADDMMLKAIEAAGRWLKPGGRVAPDRVELRVAAVGDLALPSIDGLLAPRYGVNVAPLAGYARQRWIRGDFHPRLLLSEPMRYADYEPPRARAFDERVALRVTRAGRLRGLLGWFEARLAPGITLSNAPATSTHWGQVCFPLFEHDVEEGDVLDARLAFLEGDWTWSGRLLRGERVIAEASRRTGDDYGTREVPPAPAPPPADDASRVARAWEVNERAGEAYHAGRLAEARGLWEEAVRLLPPRDPACPPIYENLGLAYLDSMRPGDAVPVLLRALDGEPISREQSLRMLIFAFHDSGRPADAARARDLYEQAFGAHPMMK